MQKLNQFLSRLQKLAEEFNLAVLLTNQVQSDPGVGSQLTEQCTHAKSTSVPGYRNVCQGFRDEGRSDQADVETGSLELRRASRSEVSNVV